MTAKYILNVVCSFIKIVAWITSLIVFIKDEAPDNNVSWGRRATLYEAGKTIAGEGRAEITSSVKDDFKGFVFPRRRRL